jgi:magnesium transporter
VVFTPINILAGMGGMSEFSMMTQGIPWPLAYGGFLVGAGFIGVMTFLLLKRLERREIKTRKL